MSSKYKVIELTQGYVAVVDADIYRKIVKYSWHVHKAKGKGRTAGRPYARTNIKGKKVYLHRYIMDVKKKNMHVDHLNHNTLDNRRDNLEVVTHAENQKRRRNTKRTF